MSLASGEMRRPGTSEYVQGVEVPMDYHGEVPEGFDVLELPEAEYVVFQGEPFAEEDYCQAIEEVQEAIKKYQPAVAGYQWDGNPRIQLEPIQQEDILNASRKAARSHM